MIEEIKQKLDIVELVGNYVKLQKAGYYQKGLCPFHGEKTPSFFVSPQKQVWKCFGCGEGGDVISFFQKIEHLEFKEALDVLCEKLGIERQKISPKEKEEKDLIFEINRVSLRFFRKQLQENKDALKYLTERGLKEKTIDFFNLGYAPANSGLRDYLFSLGYNLQDLVRAGVITGYKDDRFQSRIMFPILDHLGRIVAFTGRIFPNVENTAKYLNTPDTPVFKKSHILYGLYDSAMHIKEKKEAVVVEGQMDFLRAYQEGLNNVIAISGTAFTPEQLRLLKRHTQTILFALDEDDAGLKATLRSAPLAKAVGFEVKKLVFSKGKDLAEFLDGGEVSSLETVSIAEYVFSYAQKKYDAKTLEGKKGIMEMMLPQIKFLHPVEVDGWIQKLSSLIGVRQDLIIDELKKIVIDTGQPEGSAPQKSTRNDSAMQDLLTMLLKKYLGLALFLKDTEAMQHIAEYAESFQSIVESALQQDTTEETEMLALQGAYDAQQHENVKGELEFLLHEIKKEHLRKKIKSFVEIMKVANLSETDTMLEEIRGFTHKLEELEKQQPWQ